MKGNSLNHGPSFANGPAVNGKSQRNQGFGDIRPATIYDEFFGRAFA